MARSRSIRSSAHRLRAPGDGQLIHISSTPRTSRHISLAQLMAIPPSQVDSAERQPKFQAPR